MKTDEGTIASSLNALQHLPINFCLLSLHSRKYLSTSIYFYFAFHSLGVTVTLFWRNHIWQIFKYGNGICVQREGYCIKSHCEIHTSHYTVYVSIRSSAVGWVKGTIDRLNVSKVLQRLYAECRCREKEIKRKKESHCKFEIIAIIIIRELIARRLRNAIKCGWNAYASAIHVWVLNSFCKKKKTQQKNEENKMKRKIHFAKGKRRYFIMIMLKSQPITWENLRMTFELTRSLHDI